MSKKSDNNLDNNIEQNDIMSDETIVEGDVIDNNEADIVEDSESDNTETDIKDDVAELPVNHFTNILLSAKGRKLSPKTENHVFYEVAKHDEDQQLYLRLSGNECGGLHSKEWILLQSVIEVLDQQCANPTAPFKSLILKPLFKGSSANNVGFLAGALRSGELGLIKPAEKGVFLHLISDDYEANKAKLFSLGNDQ